MLLLERPCDNSEVVLDDDDPLDELHPVVVELIIVVNDLFTLEVKLVILLFLLMISFGDELLQVMDLLIEVPVDVNEFTLRHLEDCGLLRLEDLHLVLGKI